MTPTARHSPENGRPITPGAPPQALRTPDSAPDRATVAEIQASGDQTAASGAFTGARQPRRRPHQPISEAQPSRQGKPDRAEHRSPRSGRLDSPAQRSYPYPTTTIARHAECGLIQPAIRGVKSDTRHYAPRLEHAPGVAATDKGGPTRVGSTISPRERR